MTYIGSSAASQIGLRRAPQQLFTYGNVGLIAAILDCVCIVAASIAAGIGYHWLALGNVGDVAAFVGVGINAALLFVLLAKSRGMYRPTALLQGLEWRKIIGCWVAVLLVMVSLLFLFKLSESYSRGASLGFAVLGLVLLLGSRALIANRLGSALSKGRIAGKRAVIVGERDELDQRSAGDFLRNYGIREVGRFELPPADADNSDALPESRAVLRAVTDAARVRQAELVLVAIGWTHKARYDVVCDCLRALPLPAVLLPDRSVRSILSQPMAEMGSDIAVQVQRAPLSAYELAVKRTLDLVGAVSALLLLWPVLLTMAVAIKLSSSGDVVFRQKRRGFNGREFTIYKFRTMTVVENGPAIEQARPNDARVTALGAFMRASSIDELPQLINVIRGEMSLVGPRPHAVAHDNQYSERIANYAARQRVKPGITGWAQVNGFRGETRRIELMAHRVDCDLWYINNWSIWLDLRILMRTCIKVSRDRNAY